MCVSLSLSHSPLSATVYTLTADHRDKDAILKTTETLFAATTRYHNIIIIMRVRSVNEIKSTAL